MAKKKPVPIHRKRRKKDEDRPPRPSQEKSLLDRAPRDIQEEIVALRKHEDRILEALKDPEMADLYLRNPRAVFEALKIPLPPGLQRRLRSNSQAVNFLQSRSFRLPTGQVINPKVRVHFTPRESKENEDVR